MGREGWVVGVQENILIHCCFLDHFMFLFGFSGWREMAATCICGNSIGQDIHGSNTSKVVGQIPTIWKKKHTYFFHKQKDHRTDATQTSQEPILPNHKQHQIVTHLKDPHWYTSKYMYLQVVYSSTQTIFIAYGLEKLNQTLKKKNK